MKKVLFITTHRTNRAPGQRFRFEQYLDFLAENGFSCEVSYLISEKDDKSLYKKGKYFEKLLIVLKSFLKRRKDKARANDFDIIYIFRQAFLIGPPFFEEQYAKSRAKIIFDFDDSIWLGDTSEANKRFRWLKYPGKISKIISISNVVFSGNRYLANYASKYNSNVKIVPTTIDTEEYKRNINSKRTDGKVCIGWTGSITTIKHFEFAVPILRKLKEMYGDKLVIKVIGDKNYVNKELDIKGQAWNKENEIDELSSFDIGIMPLPDDEWAKGKCGLKGLQYMALEIPAIMSPVGVNSEIIKDGANGFLAKNDEEWIEKLALLIDNAALREAMGKEARKTIVEQYSKNSEKGKYLQYFNDLLQVK
jgi:glycosyltransferase involved in cell wall biosynthesis